MQTQTALVRSDRTVELYTVTGIYLNLTFIVNPWYTELDTVFPDLPVFPEEHPF